MPRIRTIKPELWLSPQVMDLSHSARLLFIGLITQADDEGRGSADERRLKAAVFGGDDVSSENVRRWLDEVSASGLAVVYESAKDGLLYELPSWSGHQRIDRPKASTYPKPGAGPAVARRAIDDQSSMSLRGSEGSEGSEGSDRKDRTRTRARAENGHDRFDEIKALYPKFSGRQDWINAQHYYLVRIEHGVTHDELADAVRRYAAFVTAGGVSGPQYVLTPGKFFSAADEPWRQLWDPPSNKAEQRTIANLEAAAQAKTELFGVRS